MVILSRLLFVFACLYRDSMTCNVENSFHILFKVLLMWVLWRRWIVLLLSFSLFIVVIAVIVSTSFEFIFVHVQCDLTSDLEDVRFGG